MLDIEIMPKVLGDSWRTMSADCSSLISMAWKWHKEPEISVAHVGMLDTFASNPWDDRQLVEMVLEPLNQADVIVTHYGNKFDVPYLRTKCMEHGLQQPDHNIEFIDTCRIARGKLKLSRNRLGHIAKFLGVKEKGSISHEQWFQVMRSSHEAINKIAEYNIQDVIVLEQIYNKLMPFTAKKSDAIKDANCCPKCNSTEIKAEGWRHNGQQRYQRLHCKACGAWFKGIRA